jgi:uncharacterized OB-fold protein
MLKDFLDYLTKGEFRISFCNPCNKKIWPPSYFCSDCFARTELKKFHTVGTVLEFTTSHVKNCIGTFGIVDMGGIRIIGFILGESLYKGMQVRMTSCGITQDGSAYYDFEPVSDTINIE